LSGHTVGAAAHPHSTRDLFDERRETIDDRKKVQRGWFFQA